MTRPFDLSLNREIEESSPLHWRKFWPNLQRIHPAKVALRQSIILWVANLHYSCQMNPRGFNYTEIRLTDLRQQVRDYRAIIDYFFEVDQRGFCIDADHYEVSRLIPKEIGFELSQEIKLEIPKATYAPPPKPTDGTISKVVVFHSDDIEQLLVQNKRYDLWPQVKWLLNQGSEIEFIFQKSGKLQQRDTSVWPIQAIETWPSWLREKLFGRGIDLDAAYVQFMIKSVQPCYDSFHSMKTAIPDLVDLIYDKEQFRKYLCQDVMNLPYTENNIRSIKQIIMAIANGSRISADLTKCSNYSESAKLLVECMRDSNEEHLINAANRFQRIAHQFNTAKKMACLYLTKKHPTRLNQKVIFRNYFEWERAARYAIWEECGRYGIMVHDGIDGIPEEHIKNIDLIMDKLQLKLSIW